MLFFRYGNKINVQKYLPDIPLNRSKFQTIFSRKLNENFKIENITKDKYSLIYVLCCK